MKYNYVYIIIFIIIILYLLKNIKCYEFFNIQPIVIPSESERYNNLKPTTIFDDLYFKSGNKYYNALDNETTLDTPPTNYITIKKGDDGINGRSITTDPPKGQCNSDIIHNLSELKNFNLFLKSTNGISNISLIADILSLLLRKFVFSISVNSFLYSPHLPIK